MPARAISTTPNARVRRRHKRCDRVADRALRAVCIIASALVAVLIADIGYQLLHGAGPAMSRFGLGFLRESAWKPNFGVFGAGPLLFGTAVTSAMALAIATPVGIAIGLFLSMFSPRPVRGVIGPLVEMLAAIPSVILGLWGILVLGPFLRGHAEPWLHSTLGFLPVFGPPETSGSSVFTAGLILAIMVVPIIASISRLGGLGGRRRLGRLFRVRLARVAGRGGRRRGRGRGGGRRGGAADGDDAHRGGAHGRRGRAGPAADLHAHAERDEQRGDAGDQRRARRRRRARPGRRPRRERCGHHEPARLAAALAALEAIALVGQHRRAAGRTALSAGRHHDVHRAGDRASLLGRRSPVVNRSLPALGARARAG
jgi:hypothetical protein